MKKFDFKNSPLPDYITSIIGYTINKTSTEFDDNLLDQIEEAINKAQDYEGDLEDLLGQTFDVIRWAFNLIPALEKTKIDDILVNIAEYFTMVIIKKSGKNQGLKFRDKIFARIKAKRATKNKKD